MISRLGIFSILLLFSVMCTHSFGRSEEARHRRDLEQYNITVLPRTLVGNDFVYIDSSDTIITANLNLLQANLSTGEQKIIEIPEGWEDRTGRRFEGIRRLQYDKTTDSIHALFRYRNTDNKVRLSYHILYLENYEWEEIEELESESILFWVDSENMLIYRRQNIGPTPSVSIYDLRRREIVDRVELPDDIYYVYSLYGSPPKILASTRSKQNQNLLHYFIYDLTTKTRVDFPESILRASPPLDIHTPPLENGCFIGVESRKGDNSAIVLIDLNTNTRETVALDDFPYVIGNFKQIAEGKYGFLVSTRTWTGGHGPSFLCFLDYP